MLYEIVATRLRAYDASRRVLAAEIIQRIVQIAFFAINPNIEYLFTREFVNETQTKFHFTKK